MISTNDTTILAMLSRYPDMSVQEADSYIAKIENEENIPICHAVLGRIHKSELQEDARRTYEEFNLWSQRRTRRVREEQWTTRRRQKETSLALKMNQLHQRGIVSDEILLLYGISGDLPEREMYIELNSDEKQALWEERMESRFGPNWRNMFARRNIGQPLFSHRKFEYKKTNWLTEGF